LRAAGTGGGRGLIVIADRLVGAVEILRRLDIDAVGMVGGTAVAQRGGGGLGDDVEGNRGGDADLRLRPRLADRRAVGSGLGARGVAARDRQLAAGIDQYAVGHDGGDAGALHVDRDGGGNRHLAFAALGRALAAAVVDFIVGGRLLRAVADIGRVLLGLAGLELIVDLGVDVLVLGIGVRP